MNAKYLILVFLITIRSTGYGFPEGDVLTMSGGYRYMVNPNTSNLFENFPRQPGDGGINKTEIDIDGSIGESRQYSNGMGIEFGASIGPVLEVSRAEVSDQLSPLRVYLMPLWRTFFFEETIVQTLGLEFGVSFLEGKRVVGGVNYRPTSNTLFGGLIYRIERSFGSYKFGVEFSYLFEKYPWVDFEKYSDSPTPFAGKYVTLNASNPSLDFSGPSLKCIISYWSPWGDKNRRLPRVPSNFALPDDLDPDDRNLPASEASQKAAEELAAIRDDVGALKLFISAVTFDPLNSSAWVGLGQTEDRLAHPKEALKAFQKAAKLKPDDLEIKKLVSVHAF